MACVVRHCLFSPLSSPTFSSVRKEWAERFGLTHFITPAFQASLDRISARIGVSTTAITHNTPNQLLLDGCRKLGYPASAIPQNTAGKAHACGWCHLGCPTGVKQGVHVTYLKEAAQNGAKMVCECEVDRIVRDERGNVVGVDVTIGNGGSEGADKGSSRKMRITSSIVVVSAGSLNTPVILLRSGFQNKHIGQHLHVHPVVIAMGVFPGTRTRMSHGSIMTAISSVGEMGPTGDGYGTRLEVPTSHPILGGAILPFIAPFVKERVYAKQNRMIAYKFAEMAVCRGDFVVHSLAFDDNITSLPMSKVPHRATSRSR